MRPMLWAESARAGMMRCWNPPLPPDGNYRR
jgi:hypothetical protein